MRPPSWCLRTFLTVTSSGRISVYAASDQSHAQGYTDNIIVGGTAGEFPDDDLGPVIELYLGDETFTTGGLTTSTPEVLAKIFDESGVNTVGAGVGHEMLLVLDENEEDAVKVGALYESEENSYQRGTVQYKFNEPLTPGMHTLSMRAWDVLNNSGSSTLEFVVADEAQLVVRNVLNYPNPTTGPTRFVFEHNQVPGTPVSVQVRIYSLAGRPVRTIETEDALPGGAMQIIWDGTDDGYARLPSGVYLYKVRVETLGSGGERQVSEIIETAIHHSLTYINHFSMVMHSFSLGRLHAQTLALLACDGRSTAIGTAPAGPDRRGCGCVPDD